VTTSWNLGRGPAITTAELGDPTTSTDWALCVYGSTYEPLLRQFLPAGPQWRAAKGGFRFRQTDAGGRTIVQLKPGVAGKSKVTAKHKCVALPIGLLGFLEPPFFAELRSSEGSCFGARFDATRVHTPATLKATDGRAQ
jgi:hypothetical protein